LEVGQNIKYSRNVMFC